MESPIHILHQLSLSTLTRPVMRGSLSGAPSGPTSTSSQSTGRLYAALAPSVRLPPRLSLHPRATPPHQPSESTVRGSLSASLLSSSHLHPLDPSHVVHRVLQVCRKSDANALHGYLAPPLSATSMTTTTTTSSTSTSPSPPPLSSSPSSFGGPMSLGGDLPHTSTLSRFARQMDTVSLRVLPGHLLRRARVLSAFHIPGCAYVQRVHVVARSGEEAVLTFTLHHLPSSTTTTTTATTGSIITGTSTNTGASPPSPSLLSSSPLPAMAQHERHWWVSSVVAEEDPRAPAALQDLPGRPHPRARPETVVWAQLTALLTDDGCGGDVASALEFCATSSTSNMRSKALPHAGTTPTSRSDNDDDDGEEEERDDQGGVHDIEMASWENREDARWVLTRVREHLSRLTFTSPTCLTPPPALGWASIGGVEVALGAAGLASERKMVQEVLVRDAPEREERGDCSVLGGRGSGLRVFWWTLAVDGRTGSWKVERIERRRFSS